MIDRSHILPVKCQAKKLVGSGGIVSNLSRPVSSEGLAIMRRMEALHLKLPFAGSRMMLDFLRQEGIAIGRCDVASLVMRMAIEATYPRPSTLKSAPGHKICPYLPRKLPIARRNRIRAADNSDIPMARGCVSLVAFVHCFSRMALSHPVSTTMKADFCGKALKEALARGDKPAIFHTHQGNQFTSQAFTGVLRREGTTTIMDDCGAWRDNVVVESLRRSMNYEVYLQAYGSVSEAQSSLGRYLSFHNSRRPHASLGGPTPDQTYFDNMPQAVAALIYRHLLGVTLAGLRPHYMTLGRRGLKQLPRRRSTYQKSKAVQTNSATSDRQFAALRQTLAMSTAL